MSRICPRSSTHYCNNIGPAQYEHQYCYPCWAWYYRDDMRKLWGGPVEAPSLPTGPEPREKPLPELATKPKSIPLRAWCQNLGERLTHEAGCASGWQCKWSCRIYENHLGVRAHLGDVNETTPGSEDDCQTCPGWVAGNPPEVKPPVEVPPPAEIRPPVQVPTILPTSAKRSPPRCLVAIGTYGPMSPAVVELQIRLIRKHNGEETPILVHDDHSEESHDEKVSAEVAARQRQRLKDLCRDEGVHFRSSPFRLGHGGGDLSAFWHGIRAAKKLGYPFAWKLSMRFMIDVPNWIESALTKWAQVETLFSKQFPNPIVLSTHACGTPWPTFPYRTECVGMRIEDFDKPLVTCPKGGLLAPRSLGQGVIAEPIFAQAVYATGGGLAVAPDWLGHQRPVRRPGIVWHDVPGADKEYLALFEREGVDPGPYFHADLSTSTPNYMM